MAIFLTQIFFSLSAQDQVYRTEIKLESGIGVNREILPIVSSDTFQLIFLDRNSVQVLELDQHFYEISKYSMMRDYTNSNLLGYSLGEDGIHLFLADSKMRKFSIETLKPGGSKSTVQTFYFPHKKERFLQAFNYKNKFFLLSVKKFSSELSLYEFEGDYLIGEKTIDLSDHNFSSHSYPDLYSNVTGIEGYGTALKMAVVNTNEPISLELASDPSKLYVREGEIVITIDNELSNTKIITIDIDTYDHKYQMVNHESLNCGNALNIVSNSFLQDNKLFQVKACNSRLNLMVKDLETNETIKVFQLEEDDNSLMNSPAIQLGGTSLYTSPTDHEMNNFKAVLRKISKSDVGVAVNLLDQEYLLTIGGHLEVKNIASRLHAPVGGGTVSTPYGSVSLPSYNPTMVSFNGSKYSRTVYFKSILNQLTLDHQSGEAPDSSFDIINEFEINLQNDLEINTLFRINHNYLYGVYDKKKQVFVLYQFPEID